jgi:anti-sigma-K factor RskA
MDETSSPIDDRLLDYLDGTLPAGERATLEALLRQDPAVAARLEELQLMHMLMGGQKLKTPSSGFTASVMLRLKEEPATRNQVIRGILMIIGILLIVGIAAALVSAGVFDNTLTTLNLNNLSRRYTTQPMFPTFSLSGRVIVNSVIILNLALAFIVLDKTILRPLFQKRLNAQ